MIGGKKTYTTPEKSFLKHVARGLWIGSTFGDHGRLMEVTAIGKSYLEGEQRVIDFEATEIQAVPTITQKRAGRKQ